jgi:hypothetical protein
MNHREREREKRKKKKPIATTRLTNCQMEKSGLLIIAPFCNLMISSVIPLNGPMFLMFKVSHLSLSISAGGA